MARTRRRRIRPVADDRAHGVSPWPFVGMILMAASFFLYAASGLVAPWWAVVLLMLVWFVLFVMCCVWWTPHPRRLPVVGLVSMVVWFASLVAGGALLGWSA